MPATQRGTCEWCMGAVPARTSMLPTATCVVRRVHIQSACVGMPCASTMSRLTGQVATTHTNTITQPYLTTHSSHCTRLLLPGSATRLPRLRAGSHRKHVFSSLPTALPLLCHSGSSERSRASSDSQSDSWSNRDRRCLVALADCYVYVDH